MLKDPSARLRRAIKENNLFVIRRIIDSQDVPKDVSRRHIQTRIDMRNPDPGPNRYTSLAWAAVYGHEEIFEYLLNAGHDDEELSRDADNNTILTILAGLRSSTHSHASSRTSEYSLQDVALRMARLYFERFPFLVDWSNVRGQTALHVAATKGNEEFVRMFCDLGADFDLPDLLGNTPLHYASMWNYVSVIQLLIERGCQFAARNNEGFTASDYAFSTSTMSTLQETARAQFENNKRARRNIFAQAAARGGERSDALAASRGGERSKSDREGEKDMSRLRSGSGGSRTTSTSNSDGASGGEFDTNGLPPMPPPKLLPNQHLATPSSASSTSLGVPRPANTPSSSTVSQRGTPTASVSASTSITPSASNLSAVAKANSKVVENVIASADFSALSPVASRMKERDADAMAEYMKRNRSGSGGGATPVSVGGGNANGDPAKLKPTNGGSESLQAAVPSSSSATSPRPGPIPLAENAAPRSLRRLRPSNSAASLRPTGIIGMPTSSLSQNNPSHGTAHSTTEIDLTLLNEALDLHGVGPGVGVSLMGTNAMPLPSPAPIPPGGGTKPLDIRPRYRAPTLESQSSVGGSLNGSQYSDGGGVPSSVPKEAFLSSKELPPPPRAPPSAPPLGNGPPVSTSRPAFLGPSRSATGPPGVSHTRSGMSVKML